MNKRTRPDCSEFELKQRDHSCGDCQTDGHFLCASCRHISDFENMELSDNRMRYYPKEEKERQQYEAELALANNDL